LVLDTRFIVSNRDVLNTRRRRNTLMPTDVSRSRDGENQQSDQTSKQRDTSPKSGRIRDFATHQYQIFEQQRQDTTAENRLRHPFSTQLDTLQKMLEAPSTSKAGEKRPADIVAEVANKLKQRGLEDPTRASRLLGGTKEYADAYLQLIDEGTEGAQPGDARKEMNKFHSKERRYRADLKAGRYHDDQRRTPREKAANEEPVGYAIYVEYNLRFKRIGR
jgi:hypothetical protein